MSSDSKQTQQTSSAQMTSPYAPSQGILQSILSGAGGVNTGVTGLQNQGISEIQNAANTAGNYSPNLQALTQGLFGGGNYGQGTPGIQAAQGTAQNTLGNIATGPLNPMSNPNTAPLVQSIIDQVTNSVGDQFAAANRGTPADSGYGTRALATGLSQGLANPLFNQYNANVANASNAANSLTNNAIGASNAYNQTATGQLGAQLQAPGSIGNLGIPGAMQLGAGGLPEQTQIGNLGNLSSLVLPIASAFPSQTGNNTQTTTQKGNLAQTLTGGALGGLGLLGQSGAFGTAAGGAGWLGPALTGLTSAIPFL